MKFCDALNPLYLDTDASYIGLAADLLQMLEGMNCRHDVMSDSAALYSITFASKSLSSMEWWHSTLKGKH